MTDSYMEELLPFKSNPELLDEYIFSDGKIRTGKLLEGTDFVLLKRNKENFINWYKFT